MLHINMLKHTELQKPQTNHVQEYVDHLSHIVDLAGQTKEE